MGTSDMDSEVRRAVQNGWGLTETSPVLACRRLRAGENVRGSVGLPMPGTQVRVVHPNTRADLADGEQVCTALGSGRGFGPGNSMVRVLSSHAGHGGPRGAPCHAKRPGRRRAGALTRLARVEGFAMLGFRVRI